MGIEYTCKGPRVHAAELGRLVGARRTILSGEYPMDVLDRAELADVQSRIAEIIEEDARVKFPPDWKPCGQDLTTLIQAIPVDGQDYSIHCPRCGTAASVMRAP